MRTRSKAKAEPTEEEPLAPAKSNGRKKAAKAQGKVKTEPQSAAAPPVRRSKRSKAEPRLEEEMPPPTAATAPRRSKRAKAAKAEEAAPAAPRRSKRVKSEPAAPTVAPNAAPKKKNTKRKGKAAASTGKRRKKGFTGTVDTSAALGVVDPQSNLDGDIILYEYDPLDAMLVLVDPSKNMDKYLVLQAVELFEPASDGAFAVYTRWGRTGTAGQGLVKMFAEEKAALKAFFAEYKEKSGNEWQIRHDAAPPGKYSFVEQNFDAKLAGYNGAVWQYWIDDFVDCKPQGWYNYSPDASCIVEQLFHELPFGGHGRYVQSGSNGFTYLVNLSNYTQMNLTHPNHTVRHIRRVDNDGSFTPLIHTDSGPNVTTVMSVRPVLVPSNPGLPSQPAPAPMVKSQPIPVSTRRAKQEPKEEAKEEEDEEESEAKLRPVDFAIDISGRTAGEFELVGNEFDVTLNQCNITGGNNNNKYYRIQLLTDTQQSDYYCWMRWGRVGEQPRPSQSKLLGPYSEVERAQKEFEKKWKDKTGNSWGEDFVAKSGKYEPVLIDTETEPAGDDGNSTIVTKVKKVYEPTKLDPTTLDLIQTIHNKTMMQDALLEFQIDVKR